MLLDSSSSGAFVSSSPANAEALIERISSNISFWYNKRDSRLEMYEVKGSVAHVAKFEATTQEIKKLQAVVDKLEAKSQPCMALALYCNICGGPHDTNIRKSTIQIEEVEAANYPPPQRPNGLGSENANWKQGSGWQNQGYQGRTQGKNAYGTGMERRITYGPNYNQGQSNTLYRSPGNSQGEMVMQKCEAKDIEERLSKAINDLKRDQGFLRQEITQEIRQEIASVKQEYTLSLKNIETQMSQMFWLMSERPWGTLPSNTENNPKERVNDVSLMRPKEEERKDAMEKVCEGDKTYTVKVKEQEITSWDLLRKEEGKEVEKEATPPQGKAQAPRKDFDSDEEEVLPQINLGEVASVILHKGCPKKQGDPGAFFVNCVIGDCIFKDALKLLCIAPTPLVVRLADGTTRNPRGVVEKVLVKIGRNFVPVDFIVLDVGKDIEVPLILGRPFLATCRALIDVGTGKLIIRINDDEVDESQKEKKEDVCSVITKRAKKKIKPWWEIGKVSWVPKCLNVNDFEEG
ncbi:PREDICTED: uncharacterized protein LOC109185195 [Ipomoea nil]|uniref:uncharacterized protein LOC109185195 n=1 Tax=Ipomoea nil TaxID=35883 RepID=UPI00090132CD|nr:PREDICTED: uncharacterized protein LOC109185195 [Ipomoea nil]